MLGGRQGIFEGILLSAGLLFCIVSASGWLARHGDVAAALSDGRLWSAAHASISIGVAVGAILATAGLCFVVLFLLGGGKPHPVIVALAIAAFLTPDIVYALIWRSTLQPDSLFLPSGLRSYFAGELQGQFTLLSLVISIKWLPAVVWLATASAPRHRRTLFDNAVLSGVPAMRAFVLAHGGYLLRAAVFLFLFGLVLGLRQHEFSEVLFAGGAGFRLEGASQWATKVALTFLDPGRAAAQILALLLAFSTVVAIALALTRWSTTSAR